MAGISETGDRHMSAFTFKRGTAVIWTSPGENLGSATMTFGIVQAPEDSGNVTIEVVVPNESEKRVVTVPAEQVRHF
jgi:hypothetical protein